MTVGLGVSAILASSLANLGGGADAIGESCAACHGVLVDEYRGTEMARAIERIRPGEFEGIRAVADHGTGFSYELRERGSPAGGVVHEIVERWGEGAAAGSRAVPLQYAIGAGRLDRSYVALAGGMEWFAPLEVLSARGGLERQAALAPGHEMVAGMRFGIGITNECLVCHTDQPPPIDYPANVHSAAWEPRGIGCAACHAAGEEHARFREGGSEGEDPVLALRELGLAERISLCARCHLQGDARISLSGSRGLSRPGVDFLDEWAVYLPQQQDEDVAFVSQVERMLTSACFSASLVGERGPLECTTCHDPHRSLAEDGERERVRGACMGCHAGGDEDCARPAGGETSRDCVDCHMPLVGVFDVGRVRIHDHEIARAPASPESYSSVRVKHARDGDVARFAWPWEETREDDPGLEMMAALIAGGEGRALERVDAEPGARTRRLSTYHHLRGVLLAGAGRLDEARRSYLRALLLDPDSSESSVNLALVLGQMGRQAEGIAHLDAVLEDHPRAEGALRNRAILRYSLGDQAGFARDLRAADSILPRAENERALAEAARRAGDAAGARLWEMRAKKLGPAPQR